MGSLGNHHEFESIFDGRKVLHPGDDDTQAACVHKQATEEDHRHRQERSKYCSLFHRAECRRDEVSSSSGTLGKEAESNVHAPESVGTSIEA